MAVVTGAARGFGRSTAVAIAANEADMPLKVPCLKPEDLALAAVFLASDLAAMVTRARSDVAGGDGAQNQS